MQFYLPENPDAIAIYNDGYTLGARSHEKEGIYLEFYICTKSILIIIISMGNNLINVNFERSTPAVSN